MFLLIPKERKLIFNQKPNGPAIGFLKLAPRLMEAHADDSHQDQQRDIV